MVRKKRNRLDGLDRRAGARAGARARPFPRSSGASAGIRCTALLRHIARNRRDAIRDPVRRRGWPKIDQARNVGAASSIRPDATCFA
jgi:hypothetical protein